MKTMGQVVEELLGENAGPAPHLVREVKLPKPKRRKPAALAPLTMKYLRELGYVVAKVERWNSFTHHREDLFGFVDVLAVGKGETIAVQVSRAADVTAHQRKFEDDPKVQANIAACRDANWRLVIHGWSKVAGRWRVREVDVS